MFCRLHTARSHLSSLHMQPMNAKSPVQNSLETKNSRLFPVSTLLFVACTERRTSITICFTPQCSTTRYTYIQHPFKHSLPFFGLPFLDTVVSYTTTCLLVASSRSYSRWFYHPYSRFLEVGLYSCDSPCFQLLFSRT